MVVAAGRARWGELARRLLEPEGDVRVVAKAPHLKQAVAAVRAHRPAVILVDQQISPGGALTLVPALRHAHPPVRVLAVTHHRDDAFALDLVRRGGHGVIAEEALGRYLPKAVRCLAAGQAWVTRLQEAQALETLWRLTDARSLRSTVSH